MQIIRRIGIINFLFIIFIAHSSFAEYATSTPSSIESIDFGAILDSFKSTESSASPADGSSAAASSQSQTTTTTTTWTGFGNDGYASTAANWSGNLVPQNGDRIAFDGTSGENAIWDVLVTLYSLIIGSDYTGIVSIPEKNLTIGNFVQWTGGGGADTNASNPYNWSNNTVPQNGDNILFDGSSSNNCTWNIIITPKIFVLSTGYMGIVTLDQNLSMTGSLTVSGGTLALGNKALNVDGDLFLNPMGTIDAGSSTITVKGNWSNNNGVFSYGTSTVVLAGIIQYIYGNTTFYNLSKTVATADAYTLYFEAGKIQTIMNALTLQGMSGNLLSLRSTVNDPDPQNNYWYIDPRGTRNISFADIQDLYCINFNNIVVLPDSHDSGHNFGISYGGNECVCLGSGRRTC